MRDPHVVSLSYRLVPVERVTFAKQVAPVEAESEGFKVRLTGGSLVVEMLAHHGHLRRVVHRRGRTAVNKEDGTVTYSPPAGFSGTDTFTYEVCDDGTPRLCDTATVTVAVENRAPEAVNDLATTPQNTPVVIKVVANDSDPDGDPFTVAFVESPTDMGGTAVNNGNGAVTYTPPGQFVGTDTFDYEICDNGTPPLCDTATVAVTVTEPSSGDVLFLLLDEDAIDNGGAANNFSATDVNDQQAKLAQRAELAYFDRHRNGTITLYSGQVGDEGWFAPKAIPSGWDRTGPTPNGSRNFVGNPSQPYPHNVGPGLGTADHNGDRESLLDKIRNVTPLRASGLDMLEGKVQVEILDAENQCEQPLRLFTDAPVPSSSSEPYDPDPDS